MNMQLYKRLGNTGGVAHINYVRSITIDHTQCGSSNSSNFPVLVAINDSTMKSLANGGYVNNANGYDIIFSSDRAGTSLYSWDVDFYDPVNGILVAHVQVPTVSHTTNTTFYMNVGNTMYTSYQGGATGAAWNSNYKAVYHFANGTTLGLNDSTANGQNLTDQSGNAHAVAGQIDGGAGVGTAYAATYLYKNTPSLPTGNAARTLSIWFKLAGDGYQGIMGYGDTSGTNSGFSISRNNAGFIVCQAGGITQTRFNWSFDKNWHLLHCVMPAGDDLTNTKFYLDGALQTISFTINGTMNTNNVRSTVGIDAALALAAFTGIVDEARFLNVALGADWITTEYNNQKAGSTFYSLAAWAPM